MAKNASLSSDLLIKKGNQATASLDDKQRKVAGYYKSLTIKLDRVRYERLKHAGITLDKKSQEIFLEALDLWFEKNVKN